MGARKVKDVFMKSYKKERSKGYAGLIPQKDGGINQEQRAKEERTCDSRENAVMTVPDLLNWGVMAAEERIPATFRIEGRYISKNIRDALTIFDMVIFNVCLQYPFLSMQ